MAKILVIFFITLFTFNSYSMSKSDLDVCLKTKTDKELVAEIEEMKLVFDEVLKVKSPWELMLYAHELDRLSSLEETKTCKDVTKIIKETKIKIKVELLQGEAKQDDLDEVDAEEVDIKQVGQKKTDSEAVD